MSRTNAAADLIDTVADAVADRVARRVTELLQAREPQLTPDPPYFTQRELAERLKVSGRTVEKWRGRGMGPPYRLVGRRALYSSSAVARWLESGTAASGGTAHAASRRRARSTAAQETRREI